MAWPVCAALYARERTGVGQKIETSLLASALSLMGARFLHVEALDKESAGDIRGMIMVDEQGELVTRDVRARFVNGKASALEATFIWKSEIDFERFMRFAKRYAEKNGLGYSQTSNEN